MNSHALSRGASFYDIRTDSVAAREAFDYWRSLFPQVALAPMASDGGRSYHGATFGCLGDDGIRFDAMRADAVATHYSGTADSVRLCVLLDGVIDVTHGKDRRDRFLPGRGVALLDTSRIADVDSPSGYRALHIAVPRAAVYRAMGEPIVGSDSARLLPDTPISAMLKAQMDLVAQHGRAMTDGEAAVAMRVIGDLATAYLGSFHPHDARREESPADDALFAAALTLIDHRIGEEGLTAERVARALRCSRARLYRIFQRRGIGIAGHIRDTRLRHSRKLLRDARLSVGEIAWRCGYSDLSAFGKAFHRAYGASPRDWRMAVQSGGV